MVRDPDGNVCKTRGELPQMARTRPLVAEELAARLSKTGGTPFRCADVDCRIEPGFTLSAAAINAMRRDVLTQLMAVRARRAMPELGKPRKVRDVFGRREEPGLTVQITTREQLTGRLLKMMPQLIYVPLHLVSEDPEFFRYLVLEGQNIAVALPRIVHDGELEQLKQELQLARSIGIREALVGNLGLMIPVRECGLHIRGDFGLNIYNSGSVNVLKKLELASATLSFEMTMPQIRDVSKLIPCEILIYGRLPLMVTEHCLIKNRTGECNCHLVSIKLTDKTGAEFPVIKDGNSCRSVLLNGKKLSWLDRQEDLARIGVWATRLYFTTENKQEVDRVLSDYVHPNPFDPGASTRGLYLRGLE
jgi:putative protease